MDASCSTAKTPRPLLRYRNRDICEEDIRFLRSVIEQHGGSGRTKLAGLICEAWDWRQANGGLSLQACLDLLRRLDWGHIEIPGQRHGTKGKRNLPKLSPDLIPLVWRDISEDEVDLGQVQVRPVAPDERMGWRLFVGRFHYLGCRPIVGEHLLYVALHEGEVVSLLGWASAALRAVARRSGLWPAKAGGHPAGEAAGDADQRARGSLHPLQQAGAGPASTADLGRAGCRVLAGGSACQGAGR